MLESFKNMTNCGVKKRIYAYKKMPSARVELTISSLLVRCLTNLAIKAYGKYTSDLGEGRTHDLKINSLTP